MRISDNQVNEVKKLLTDHAAVHGDVVREPRASYGASIDSEPEVVESPRPTDGPMIERLTREVMGMPDRDEYVAELKAKIEAGQYNPTGDEIADAMIRRAIADRIK
ncbi:MAG TPA: flagellar biosynthesis anti-sigma factor FlgM [Fimbriimonadaceae bacterium]|nr:flagellar biosynthesis anti-sigma factor FlgM [Fimbriimonadaceae bacterium]